MHCVAGDSSTAWLTPSVDRIQAAFGAVKKAAALPATAVGSHAAMWELRQEIAAQARERQEAAAQAAAEAAAEETAADEVGSHLPVLPLRDFHLAIRCRYWYCCYRPL